MEVLYQLSYPGRIGFLSRLSRHRCESIRCHVADLTSARQPQANGGGRGYFAAGCGGAADRDLRYQAG